MPLPSLLHAVAQFVACNDQVWLALHVDTKMLMWVYKALAVADKQMFQNCLVAMRPKATRLDLPTTFDIGKHLHNEFIGWLTELKRDITVSMVRSSGWQVAYLDIYRMPQGKSRQLQMDGLQTIQKCRFLG